MGDVRRDGHYHRDEYPKRTERGWVHRDGEITPGYLITSADAQGRTTPDMEKWEATREARNAFIDSAAEAIFGSPNERQS